MLYRVNFTRRVVTYDSFTREIEADSAEEAQHKADDVADAANRDCPDDAEPGDYLECGDWQASSFAKWGDPEWRDSLGASADERPAGF